MAICTNFVGAIMTGLMFAVRTCSHPAHKLTAAAPPAPIAAAVTVTVVVTVMATKICRVVHVCAKQQLSPVSRLG